MNGGVDPDPAWALAKDASGPGVFGDMLGYVVGADTVLYEAYMNALKPKRPAVNDASEFLTMVRGSRLRLSRRTARLRVPSG